MLSSTLFNNKILFFTIYIKLYTIIYLNIHNIYYFLYKMSYIIHLLPIIFIFF